MATDDPDSGKKAMCDGRMEASIEAITPRVSGQWRDKVSIAPDFDALPDELQLSEELIRERKEETKQND